VLQKIPVFQQIRSNIEAYYKAKDGQRPTALPRFVLFADLKSMMAAADLHYKHNQRCCLFCGILKQYVATVLKEPQREGNLCHPLERYENVGVLGLNSSWIVELLGIRPPDIGICILHMLLRLVEGLLKRHARTVAGTTYKNDKDTVS
jgi:hypothetical protein